MALSANALRDRLDGAMMYSPPVNGGALIYFGALCCLNSDGDCIAGVDAASVSFAGVAAAKADNSDGSDGDVNVTLYREGVFEMTSSGLDDGDVGKAVYLLDDTTVGLSGHTDLNYHVYVGKIVRVLSATSAYVELDVGGVDPNLFDGVVKIAGTNAAALDFDSHEAAVARNGTGFYVKAVHDVLASVTSTKAMATAAHKVVTTNYTLADGVITTVTDESANTLHISMLAIIKQ